MKHIVTWTFLSLVFTGTCFAYTPVIVAPSGMEQCFGIADAGQNDGPFMADYPEATEGAGGSKYPCERTAWRWVPKGKCTTIMIGFTKDGTALTGTLEPRSENVNPEKCLPYKEFGNQGTAGASGPDNAKPGDTAGL